ncbi:hypothetical protein [Rothia mucilaginosa]|uniref:hypothetical protein n=1 Tax=Rothia mucilaginosa TaxID=43675 RepID=UPI0026F2EE10|nr:hypothetical protein [Rothia mucilaginosa]
MSKIFWLLIPLTATLVIGNLLKFSAASLISAAILGAAIYYQVRTYLALRTYEKEMAA